MEWKSNINYDNEINYMKDKLSGLIRMEECFVYLMETLAKAQETPGGVFIPNGLLFREEGLLVDADHVYDGLIGNFCLYVEEE